MIQPPSARNWGAQLMFRIAVFAADRLGRDCLVSLLSDCGGVEVVAVAADPGALGRAAAGATPDAVLVVGDGAGGATIPAPERLRSVWPAAELLLGSFEPAGAGSGRPVAGYRRVVDLSGSGDAIAAALMARAAPPGSPAANADGGAPAPGPPSGTAALTRRETEVLRHLAAGLTSRESADRLGLRSRTVDGHRRSVSRKLALSSTAELTRFAIAAGLIDAGAEGAGLGGSSE